MSQSAILRHRRDTASNWTTNNPVLEEGQLGFETDTLKFKMGDGNTQWSVLPYQITEASVTRGAAWGMSSGAIVTPVPKVYVHFPRAATIRGVTVLGIGGPGSCSIGIGLISFAAYPGAAASIVAAAAPAISAAHKYTDATLTGWTVDIPAGSILEFDLTSSSTFTNISIVLDLEVLNG